MSIRFGQYSEIAILSLDALEFAGDDCGGFVPSYSLVFTFATILRVCFSYVASGFPINSLERVPDAVGRVNPFFVALAKWCDQHLFVGRFENFSTHFDLPGFLIIFIITFIGVANRSDPDNFAILNFDPGRH